MKKSNPVESKKLLFSPDFLFILLISIFWIVLPSSLSAQTQVSWYASNGVGMKNRGIIPEDAGKYKWVLKQIMSPEKEDIYLYKEGKEYRHIEREFNAKREIISEMLSLNGKISEKKSFDSEGDIKRKLNYNENGAVDSRTKFNYSPSPEKQLLSIEIFDKTGRKISENFFSLRKDGSLRKIVQHKTTTRSIPDISLQGRKRSGTRFTTSYSSIDGIKTISLFDNEGRISKEEKFKGTKLIQTIIWSYKEKLNIKTRCVISNLELDKTTLIIYNTKGLIFSEKITISGILKERTGYKYNEKGQVIEKRFKNPEESGRISYQYKGEDVSVETLYRGDELYSIIRYISNKKRIEEKYRNNEIVLKIHYVDRVKILDQFFLDGEMIREKKYK